MRNSSRRTLAADTGRRAGRHRAMCRAVINEFFNAVTAALADGRKISIRHHMAFIPRTRAPRDNARNPRTGKRVLIPPRKTAVCKFMPGYLK